MEFEINTPKSFYINKGLTNYRYASIIDTLIPNRVGNETIEHRRGKAYDTLEFYFKWPAGERVDKFLYETSKLLLEEIEYEFNIWKSEERLEFNDYHNEYPSIAEYLVYGDKEKIAVPKE